MRSRAPDAAVRHAERVRQAVAVLDTGVPGSTGQVRVTCATASVGVAARPSTQGSPVQLPDLFWAADRALHATKRAGGDTVRTDDARCSHQPVGIEIP